MLEAINKALLRKKIDSGVMKPASTKKGKKERDNVIKKKVILGTYGMVSTGLDVKDINCLFLTTPPPKNPKQVCGRILRTRSGQKTIYDCVSVSKDFNLFRNKYYGRLRWYKSQGFQIESGT